MTPRGRPRNSASLQEAEAGTPAAARRSPAPRALAPNGPLPPQAQAQMRSQIQMQVPMPARQPRNQTPRIPAVATPVSQVVNTPPYPSPSYGPPGPPPEGPPPGQWHWIPFQPPPPFYGQQIHSLPGRPYGYPAFPQPQQLQAQPPSQFINEQHQHQIEARDRQQRAGNANVAQRGQQQQQRTPNQQGTPIGRAPDPDVFDGPPCGPPPPAWVFDSIDTAAAAVKAHALANGYTVVLRARVPSGKDATIYNFRCGRGGHVPTPDTNENALGRDGRPIKRRNRTTQKTGCPFTLTIKKDKYAAGPTQVWRVQPATHSHNHAGVAPLGFRSQRSKLLDAHRDSIMMMHNDGIRVSKIRKYLKLEALPKSDFYNIIRKDTKDARQALLTTQQQQQLELQQIAGQLGQMMPAAPNVSDGLMMGSLDALTDEGQLRALMAADTEDGEDDGDEMDDDEEDEDDIDAEVDE
ncbi:hypothetical protein SEUCBS139899_002524 [Sporothrix eucalyptigena]